MRQEITENYGRLIAAVAVMPEVLSIGKSGGAALPEEGESDIDTFVFCGEVPGIEKRRAAESIGECVTELNIGLAPVKHWGTCDYVFFGQTEICLMFYTFSAIDAEIGLTLSGTRLDREDNYFYPTGRCASFLTMHVLCDKQGYIAAMQERLRKYPESLAEQLLSFHLDLMNDDEDLLRAVGRKDVLFYHFALDLALDHFLQALFALNRCYFPSRKRTISHIESFAKKPGRCAERILETVVLGANGETLLQSYEQYAALCRELTALIRVQPQKGCAE